MKINECMHRKKLIGSLVRKASFVLISFIQIDDPYAVIVWKIKKEFIFDQIDGFIR